MWCLLVAGVFLVDEEEEEKDRRGIRFFFLLFLVVVFCDPWDACMTVTTDELVRCLVLDVL